MRTPDYGISFGGRKRGVKVLGSTKENSVDAEKLFKFEFFA